MKISFFSKCVLLLVLLIMQGAHSLMAQCPDYTVSIGNTHPYQPVCPFGFPTSLYAQLKQGPTNIPDATYKWEPGSLIGQNPVVNPSVTTTYTIIATINGCTYTAVTTVTVMNVQAPAISYAVTAFNPASTVTFPVNQTGVTGGVYSIAPSHPSVTINSSTGLITAWGNCFGTYTVSYQTAPFGLEGGFCEYGYATTVVNLQNSSCSITIPVNSFTLCPGDKVIFAATITFPGSAGGGTVSDGGGAFVSGGGMADDGTRGNGVGWGPIGGTSTLSCVSCNSPTFTFGGTSTVYTMTGYYNGQVCGTAAIKITAKEFCEKEEIIGCCFSNYGAAVWLNNSNTYLNVYCNLLNELGYTPTSSIALQKGEFQNQNGSVRVLLDWIHNAKNDLYTTKEGTTTVFGADEKIKGNSNTQFYELWLDGNGTKSIWIDEYAHSNLDLTSNVLATQNFMFLMKDPVKNVIRTTGYASSGINGYFSWSMNTITQTPTQKYLFPMGATASASWPFRYRPVVIVNNSTTQTDEISVNYMNIAPSLTNDAAFVHVIPTLTNVITNQAPNVLQINNAFYHKIKKTVPTSPVLSNLSVKSFYFPVDGQFQSLAEWEKDPNQTYDWWGGTPGASASTVVSTDPGSPGMIYAMANGTLNFNHKPFTLSRGGFYLNTNNFGNTGTPGTSFSLSAVPPGSGSTPAGGGLGNPYGTGNNSGNGGNGGNTIFSPNPVAGEYIMTVNAANNCAIGGNIRFVIDQNGNISPNTVKYGIIPGSYLGELSEAVYTIDNVNSGITFSATPRNLLRNCVNSVTVTTSVNSDHVLNSGESITVILPTVGNTSNTITYGQFMIFNKANIQVFTSSANMTSGTTNLTPNPALVADIYRFELQINASTAPPITEIIRGQLIVK